MINQEEYEILKDLDDRLGSLARDRDGDLVAYEKKPEKSTRFWFDNGRMVNLGVIFDVGRLFQFIQWEDGEPYNIAELIEEYDKSQAYEIIESEEAEVKKDIEWLKGRFRGRKIFKPQNDREIGYNMAIDEFSEYVDQLDEPEVLSQELAVIPEYVAEWIERQKEVESNLWHVMNNVSIQRNDNPQLWTWIWRDNNMDKFARAWLDGYTVAEEQKYYVINNDQRMMLVRMMDGKTITEADPFKIEDMYEVEKKSHRLTEQEIKDYDERYWPFAVKVEEVE